MVLRLRTSLPETQKKRSVQQRIMLISGFFLFLLLILIARLIDLQIIRGSDFREAAHAQHYDGITLPARRGEILSRSSKTGETSILATNTTLNLVYVDPYITDDPTFVAEKLAEILVTNDFHEKCRHGQEMCPQELRQFYAPAFDPLAYIRILTKTGPLLEVLPSPLPPLDPEQFDLSDRTEVQRLFARGIEKRIAEKRVTFIPIKYGATKKEMHEVQQRNFPGISVVSNEYLIHGNPEEIDQMKIGAIANDLASILNLEPKNLRTSLLSRPLRYVPIMHQLPPDLSQELKEHTLQSFKNTQKEKREAPSREAAEKIHDPLRSVSLLPEHWRFYPDGTIASQVVGFLNNNQEAQYGIERTFNPQLRGHEGLISTFSDTHGGPVSVEQVIVQPKDGQTIVLTIDRHIQKEVERLLDQGLTQYEAESGQVIIMDPFTGKILAMANAPLFESNDYGTVYEKEPIVLTEEEERQIVLEIAHPVTNTRVVKAYHTDVFTTEGRLHLSEKTQKALAEVEELYNLTDLARYYLYIGENNRREIFPTDIPHVWLKFKNNVGVGAYLNRTIQEIYEPGSVLKPVTMAIAIDQGEITPSDTYNDSGPVHVDEYTIRNALLTYYGLVTMTNCLEFSINTCMTSVSAKLGKKLFQHMLEQFGFHHLTGIELEDELPGVILPWKKWSNALLATAAYGQGISATPLQMLIAFAALANGGKLVKPFIIDSIIAPDGEVKTTQPTTLHQVIKEESAEAVTGMLVSAVNNGYAKPARVKGYVIAGKTGTSQIAGPGGRYETGTGASIASFAGYAPAFEPKFVILVKFDRPRKVQHGAASAAPLFREIATFLFKYYGIPPNEQ